MARVLVVDDEREICEIISEMLSLEGHEVRVVPTARMGLEVCDEEEFDLVITDIVMPGICGFDMIHEIRSRHPSIGIIAMSGGGRSDVEGLLRIAFQQGGDATLVKPFTFQQLLSAVNCVLRSRTRNAIGASGE